MPPAGQQKLLLIAAGERRGCGGEAPSVKVIPAYRDCRPMTQCLLRYESRSCGSTEVSEHNIFFRSQAQDKTLPAILRNECYAEFQRLRGTGRQQSNFPVDRETTAGLGF